MELRFERLPQLQKVHVLEAGFRGVEFYERLSISKRDSLLQKGTDALRGQSMSVMTCGGGSCVEVPWGARLFGHIERNLLS